MSKINLIEAYEKASESRRRDPIMKVVSLKKLREAELSRLRTSIMNLLDPQLNKKGSISFVCDLSRKTELDVHMARFGAVRVELNRYLAKISEIEKLLISDAFRDEPTTRDEIVLEMDSASCCSGERKAEIETILKKIDAILAEIDFSELEPEPKPRTFKCRDGGAALQIGGDPWQAR